MIRQLRRLSRPIPAAGRGARALATYAEAARGGLYLRAAAETGFEGVACVDDAARAAGLYALIWQRQGFAWARTEAVGLLKFVRYMQVEDGRFANFILDWDGRRNLDSPTSALGGLEWTARAMHALALGVAAFGDAADVAAFERGLPWLDRPCRHLNIRAVHVLALLDYWRATGAAYASERALTWAEEIAASRLGAILPDVPSEPNLHLWGHLQEAALARTGQAFDRPDLVELARASAEAIVAPAVGREFTASQTVAFDVSCAVAGLDALADATGLARYARLAEQARAWFRGRNAARCVIYDRRRGLVYDGIDDGRVSRNSGAESNIEGALALLDALPWERYAPSPVRPEPNLRETDLVRPFPARLAATIGALEGSARVIPNGPAPLSLPYSVKR